ncbi:hypothetical protein CA267_001245 [Alteromonas pelagimontana]|uniref:Uncharacterized protein n=1 Tax=Alteromonas pelagimontana TaxID=1858656 RepID=A0A6M4MBI3_9ALTE|nr:hypothetical protein [Alteromonas pelagimontana]QJR79516.1 hypothetical protein CA267_001245 [Alteromonas pelagimontana]
MELLEMLGFALIIDPLKDLLESMRKSKTLTLMVVTGFVFLIAFALFLVKMAGSQ